MRIYIAFLLTVVFLMGCKKSNSVSSQEGLAPEKAEYAMVIHGGAGYLEKGSISEEREKEYTDALNEALNIGEKILVGGGSSLDAVEQTLRYLEDQPIFNAGKGAVFTHDEKNELDASIMLGADLTAGAVAGVSNVKHPISAARAVMEQSTHVLLAREGAEAFAQEKGLEIVDPSYFRTESSWNALQNRLENEKKKKEKMGTVGAVALDKEGNIVAGTSTGGMTNKRWGRIGDSPVIGAGTYANNATCGVSCTGHGEYYIRYAVAHDISALVEYKGMTVQAAAEEVIHNKLEKAGGKGGLIVLDKYGNIAMDFNTTGMHRGYVKPGERMVSIFGKE